MRQSSSGPSARAQHTALTLPDQVRSPSLTVFFVLEMVAAQVPGLAAYLIGLNSDQIDASGWLKRQIPGNIKAMIKRYSYSRRYPDSATAAPYDPIAYPEYPPVAYNIHDDADDYCDLPQKMPGLNHGTELGRRQALKSKKGDPMDWVEEEDGWGVEYRGKNSAVKGQAANGTEIHLCEENRLA